YPALWKYVTDRVKDEITLPSLWRAMEAARPLTIENDELVLGYSVTTADQRGLLLDNRHRNVIELAIEKATRKRLRLNIIIGETLEDWEAMKVQQAEAARMQTQAREQYRQQTESGQSWDAVGEQLVRKYGSLANRALPSVQGRFLDEALGVLVEAQARLEGKEASEQEERSYSRVLDRIAERVGVPSAMIAYLVHTRRSAKS
ncbi:MAG TPA: hypothetical protein VK689_21850, partial [Armatimonadota bacterium]|nr:hypothetical protein [Armatimonadota bacterium]